MRARPNTEVIDYSIVLSEDELKMLVGILEGNYLQLDEYEDLLIEEINEEVYQIDRMLQKLRLSGILSVLKGVIVGGITYKKDINKEDGYYDLFKEILEPLKIPVLYGLPIGHVTPRLTVPIGAEVEINTFLFTMKII